LNKISPGYETLLHAEVKCQYIITNESNTREERVSFPPSCNTCYFYLLVLCNIDTSKLTAITWYRIELCHKNERIAVMRVGRRETRRTIYYYD